MQKSIYGFIIMASVLMLMASCGRKSERNSREIPYDRQLSAYYKNNQSLSFTGKVQRVSATEIESAPWGVQFNLLPPHIDIAPHEYQMDSLLPAVTDLLRKGNRLGIKWARVSVNWSTIEDQQGKYHWRYLDTLLNGLDEIGIEPYLCINGGHEYRTNGLPATESKNGLKPWKKFVRAMVKRYADRVDYWEIWNEPNYPSFWKPEPNPKAYVKLTEVTSQLIREHDPESTILGGSLARMDMPYAKEMFKAGIAEYIDVVTVHPYNAIPLGSVQKIAYPIRTPDYYLPSSNQMDELLKLIHSYDEDIELWQAECGYPSGQNSHGWTGTGPWGRNIQAKWLLRRGLIDINHDAQVSGYFTLWEFKLNEGWQKNYKGLLEFRSRKPKRSYFTFQNLTSLVNGHIETGDTVNASYTVSQEGMFKGVRAKNIHAEHFTVKEQDMFCYWLPWRIQELIHPATVDIELANTTLKEPVIVDLFTGHVYAIENAQKREGKWLLKDVPLTDYPIAVTSKAAVGVK